MTTQPTPAPKPPVDAEPHVDADGTPFPVATIRAFVNTMDVEDTIDELVSPDALAQWLVDHGLAHADRVNDLGDDDLERARRVREAFRDFLTANHDETPPPPHARDVLREEAERCPLRIEIAPSGDAVLIPTPDSDPLDATIGHLLATMHNALRDGTWQRLRICRDDSCQWAFYDTSRNRSGKWCGAGCANRANVRAYRRRQRQPER